MPRILYVEDDVIMFTTVRKNMTKLGWIVDHAPGPREAVTYLEKNAPDVVLIDRDLDPPESDKRGTYLGDELLGEIVARWRYVCPIMLTGFAELDDVARLTRYGAKLLQEAALRVHGPRSRLP